MGLRLPDKAQPHTASRPSKNVPTVAASLVARKPSTATRINRRAKMPTSGVAAPFVLVELPSNRVLRYYTLSASVIRANDLPEELCRKLPRYPQLPVTLLGRLAVDITLKGRRMGQFLLMDALWRSLDAAAQIAAMAVVVDAKDKAAETFYADFGFTP